MLQATFWLFFCWDILVSMRYEVGGENSVKMCQTCFKWWELSLQTPAFNMVKENQIGVFSPVGIVFSSSDWWVGAGEMLLVNGGQEGR